MTLDELNALAATEAERALGACCGVTRWAREVAAARPYESIDTLLARADAVWRSLPRDAWREAFAHHPRIGERTAAGKVSAQSRAWSSTEQAGVTASSAQSLADANREYERRFGHIFLISAAGRGAEEIVTELRARLRNQPDEELTVAAEEQRKITALRVRKMLGASPDS